MYRKCIRICAYMVTPMSLCSIKAAKQDSNQTKPNIGSTPKKKRERKKKFPEQSIEYVIIYVRRGTPLTSSYILVFLFSFLFSSLFDILFHFCYYLWDKICFIFSMHICSSACLCLCVLYRVAMSFIIKQAF